MAEVSQKEVFIVVGGIVSPSDPVAARRVGVLLPRNLDVVDTTAPSKARLVAAHVPINTAVFKPHKHFPRRSVTVLPVAVPCDHLVRVHTDWGGELPDQEGLVPVVLEL